MIIFEGPDGGGKTTLARDISSKLNISIAPKVVDSDTNAMVDLVAWTNDNLKRGFQRKIFDRHRLLSEPIYGSVLDGDRPAEFSDVAWLRPRYRMFWDLRPVVVYCLPPLSVVMLNIQNDPDNTVVKGRIEQIYRAYTAQAAMLTAMGRAMVWDFTGPNPNTLLCRMISRKFEEGWANR